MKPSKYLEQVQNAAKLVGQDFILTGNILLVERVPQDEVKTKSGLILATEGGKNQVNSIGANLPVFVHVLAAGSGYYDEEEGDVPLDTKPGDILLVGQHSVKWLSVFPIDNYEPFSVGVTSEAETQMRFRGRDAYGRFSAALNSASQSPHEQPESCAEPGKG